MIWHLGWPAGGAKEQAFVTADLIAPVGWHPGTNLVVVVAAPVKGIQCELNAELAGAGVQHPQAFGHYFLANAVTSDDGDAMGLAHDVSSRKGMTCCNKASGASSAM